MSLNDFLVQNLLLLEAANLIRKPLTIDYPAAKYFHLENRKILNLASNNYLGFADHPEIKAAAKDAMDRYGIGSTGSRLITGTSPIHIELEKTIAHFKNKEAAIYYSTGYAANISTISALINQNDAVFSDELNHASIIDGIKLSKAEKFIYNHSDINHLKELLEANRYKYNKAIIITDTIFSMDGDIVFLKEIVELKDQYNCFLMIDEAHATGLYGNRGSGLAEHFNLTENIEIHMGTFSKAIGVEGAYVAGSINLIDYLRHKSRGFIYSTAPSPAMAGAVIKSIELVEHCITTREKLWQNIELFKKELNKNNEDFFKLLQTDSAIFCLITGDIYETLEYQQIMLNDFNIFVSAIRPPTVKTSRIRLCLNAMLDEKDIIDTVNALTISARTLMNKKARSV